MKVLIGCEESQIVCQAFRRRGHEAMSCDLQPTRGNPEWHIQGDVMDVIRDHWDLIILHPDCTAMAVCGNSTYAAGTPGYGDRLDAIEWTMELWAVSIEFCRRVALENPVSVIFPHLRKAGVNIDYVQPWQFGHGETKKTGLALHNLPPLKPTNIVEGREPRVWKMAPGPNRKRDRSATYPGVADAMADQWGAALRENSVPDGTQPEDVKP